jgi:hypothetical protein
MWLIVLGIIAGLAVVGGAAWWLVPTLRTFSGPAFEPASRDEESILRAQQSGPATGSGAGGGGV